MTVRSCLSGLRGVAILSFILSLILCASTSSAASACDPAVADCVRVGEWDVSIGLGAGVRTNPLEDGDNIPLVVIPSVSYYGERFFIDDTLLGYTFSERKNTMFSGILTIGFDQIYFDRWNLGNFTLVSAGSGASGDSAQPGLAPVVANPTPTPMPTASPISSDAELNPPSVDLSPSTPDFVSAPSPSPRDENRRDLDLDDLDERRMSVLAGIEYYHFFSSWYLNIQALQDIASVHNGGEVRFAMTYPYVKDSYSLEFSVGGVWQDDKTLDYYYGLDATEVPDEKYIYSASSGFSPITRLDWKYKMTQKWHLQLTVHSKWFDDAITDSPIVDESQSLTAFLGGFYHF